jgi:hypothetical protein
LAHTTQDPDGSPRNLVDNVGFLSLYTNIYFFFFAMFLIPADTYGRGAGGVSL